ncbi:FAD-binding domain-containing protein [Coniochaeta ligniaria NRRL 30616]|uniref:FAD-binding domain-containing protein n=1 Tax=Coniochaeta ligniaria NRRL 30616 TaxID=1408157 RepID=A0A1J7IPU2_9PEZI|nr:FAD-binding domain-containing protein [Coniochaeta ligniaria NRRL 30616]
MPSTLAAVAAILLGLGLGFSGASPLDKRDALVDCLNKAGVPTDGLGTDDWKQDAAPFNLQLNFTPVAIAVPTNVKQIQDAVACAAKLGVKANAKCGGHSYASFGLGGEDGHLTVEMDRMNAVKLDTTSGIASIEGGSRLGHVASELYAQGKRAFSHGTCPGVGVGGHALHGGYGVSSHTKGLAVDWMVGATVVLANSTVVNASATENPDLFWAIRGAGSSMGIVSSFQFKTFVVPDTVTFFVASAPWGAQGKALNGLRAVQEFALNTMPAELNMRVFITGKFVNFEGLFYGDKAGLKSALQPLLNKTSATLQLSQEGTWLDQLTHFGNGLALDQGHPYNYHETFYSTSLYTQALTDEQLTSLTTYWFKIAKANRRDWYLQIDLHGGTKSAVTAQTDSTAYAHRDYLLMYSFYDRVDNAGRYPADGFSCMQNFVGNITANMAQSDWGQYVNYPDPKLSQDQAQIRYWGKHLSRLQAIKAAVDPDNVFHYPQGILPVAL